MRIETPVVMRETISPSSLQDRIVAHAPALDTPSRVNHAFFSVDAPDDAALAALAELRRLMN